MTSLQGLGLRESLVCPREASFSIPRGSHFWAVMSPLSPAYLRTGLKHFSVILWASLIRQFL